MSLFPVFLKLTGRRVLLVGAGRVAAGKLMPLLEAGAHVSIVAPEIADEIAAAPVEVAQRPFEPRDLDGAFYVVSAAPRDVNRSVAREAARRGVFVNAVDDVENASAFAGAIIRRNGVTIAISTDGQAPALAGLLREGLDALLPRDLDAWMSSARDVRRAWLREGIPMEARRPLLLDALVELYQQRAERAAGSSR